jgi:hypothetical protein
MVIGHWPVYTSHTFKKCRIQIEKPRTTFLRPYGVLTRDSSFSVKQPVQRRSGFVTETKPELKRFGIKSQPPHAWLECCSEFYFQISFLLDHLLPQ